MLQGPNAKTKTEHALDCGAGIGRITKLFLSTIFTKVDMVELNQEFLDQARNYMGERAQKLDRLFCSGLQEFTPDAGYYDVIWCQWVLGHLTDEDLVAFFKRCQNGLAENGVLIIKENITTAEKKVFDENDSSYTRSKSELIRLIKLAGLHIEKIEKQKNFPKELFDVWMIAAKWFYTQLLSITEKKTYSTWHLCM